MKGMKWIFNPLDVESISKFLDRVNGGKDIKTPSGNICIVECNRKNKSIKNKKHGVQERI